MRHRVQKQEVHRLEDLLVEEVSIVDRPANKRRFLAVKSEGDMGKQQVSVDASGNLVTDPGETSASEIVDLTESFTNAGTVLTDVQKRLTIPSEMRSEIFRSLDDVVKRIYSVMGAADSATTSEKEESTLVPVLMSEMRDIATALNGAVKRLGAVTKSELPEPSEPVQSEPDGAAQDVQTALQHAVDAVEEAVTKRNIGKGRLGKFKAAIGTLQKILEELEAPAKSATGDVDPVVQAASDDAAKSKGKAQKSDSEIAKADFDKLAGYVEQLSAVVKTQRETIARLSKAHPTSNAIPVESTPAPAEVHWPLDMNADRSKANVKKSISFHE